MEDSPLTTEDATMTGIDDTTIKHTKHTTQYFFKPENTLLSGVTSLIRQKAIEVSQTNTSTLDRMTNRLISETVTDTSSKTIYYKANTSGGKRRSRKMQAKKSNKNTRKSKTRK
jgi:hypothetical protein